MSVSDEEAERRRIELLATVCRPPIVVGSSDVLRAAKLEPAWVVRGRIPAQDLTLITGAPGVKKSWIAYALVHAVAQRIPWLGFPIEPPAADRRGERAPGCAALVLNYDNSKAECGRRFLRLGLRESDAVYFHSLDVGSPLRFPDDADKLAVLADHLRPRVIVVDSLRQAHVAEENSSKEMMVVMGGLKRLYACGAAVVVIHHADKAGTAGSRGSGEIDASATTVIHMLDDRGIPRAEWKKHRSWAMQPEDEKLWCSIEDVGDRTTVARAEAPAKKERRHGQAGQARKEW